MTSRRPMTRSYSGNGRTSSFSEEEGSSSNGRSESRNTYLSNVRPENSYSRYSHYRPTRSTLCSVMAQLTEDIQPSFETTLKSKAVSENCNVKFTCVVSGYPAPELKWYKDDTEMDRYCGLPKYEIRRNGKTHTLHIYNCTLDDAAIYQVSASNSKGIVSCSGVLEVGTMSEYQIHQRFFAKLKQKAEKKRKDTEEHSKKQAKEDIHKEKPQVSPERPQRKRPILEPKQIQAVKEPEVVEQLGSEPNGVTAEVKETHPVASSGLNPEKELQPSVDVLATKKMKITNNIDGVNSSSSRNHVMGNGGENCYDGGISLAHFLAETLHSQAAEEIQNSKEVDKTIVNVTEESEREKERQQNEREEEKAPEEEHEREKELTVEREKEIERLLEMVQTADNQRHGSEVKHHRKGHKDHDHHNIQASISSMLHTVKDFFFGKGKRDPREPIEKKEKEFDHSLSQTPPPSYWLQPEHRGEVDKPQPEVVPMETELQMPVAIEHQSVPLEVETTHEDSVPHTDPPPAHESHLESKEEPVVHSVKEVETLVQAMEAEAQSSGPGEEMASSALLTEQAEENDSLMVLLPHPQGPDCLVVSPHPVEVVESTLSEDVSVSPKSQAASEEEGLPPTSNLRCLVDNGSPSCSVISPTDSHGVCNASTETSQGGKSADKMSRAGDMEVDSSYNQLCLEKKSEVKSTEEACPDITRSEKNDLTPCSLEERMETRESITADQMFSPQSTIQTHSSQGAKEKVECFSRKVNVEFPPTPAPEMTDLKIQQECAPSIADDSKEEEQRATQSSNSQIRPSEEGEAIICAFVKEDNACNYLQNQEVSENVNTEVEKKGENCNVTAEALVESKSLSVTKNKEESASVLEPVDVVREEKPLPWPTEEVPQVEISLCSVGATDLTPADSNTNEHFTMPNTEIIQPELKEFTLPLTILALNKAETEPTLQQKHDATAIINSVAESSDFIPTQKGMKNDSDLPPTEKVKEIAQLNDETGMFVSDVKSGEQLPQVVNTLIPIINISCTDDKEEDVNTCDSDAPQLFETPAVPVFVVPPISVTCHESDVDVRNPVECQQTETESSAERPRGTEHGVAKDMTTKPEQTEKDDEKPEGRKRAISSLKAHEALTQMIEVKSIRKTPDDNTAEVPKTNPPKEPKIENSVTVEDLLRNRSSVERLSTKPPTSPASLRKFVSKVAPDSEIEVMTSVPVITVDDHQSDRVDEDLSGGSTPTSSLSCESSPRLKRRDSLSLIRSATPEELASGARRKIFLTKSKEDGDGVGTLDTQSKRESPYMSPSQTRRAALLQPPMGQNTPPMERRSPLVSRRKATLDVPKVVEQAQTEEKPAEKKFDPLKAPQVIRKIRGEPFPDASGHLKLWCQFFNVLSDSTIKWFRDEEEILEVKRSGGDESQVALAIVLASSQDCGVYGCTIQNEYGTDTTDFLLSVDILSEILLKDDLEVGEEIEMTPLLFNKGLANSGSWGDKYFGRIMTETVHIGEGCVHKASRVKVIYGLSPVFESGSTCIVKVQNPIAYGTRQESNLAERNVTITQQECKIQNMIREYCKIFAAEARVIDNFGASIEVIPQYLMYRPANSVPFATVEADLSGVFLKYCMTDPKGRLITRSVSEVEQKCCTFQHWIYQWTHGNLLVTRLEGVGMKITNIKVVTKSKGYQGLTDSGSPEVLEQFVTHHQCNYYCGLIGLRPLKTADSLQQPTKVKGSRSPLLNRKLGQGSCSPQLQRKGQSPQMSRKANCSPKVVRKVQESGDNKSGSKEKPTEPLDVLETR